MTQAERLQQALVKVGFAPTLHQDDDCYEGDQFLRLDINEFHAVEIHVWSGQFTAYWAWRAEPNQVNDTDEYPLNDAGIIQLIGKIRNIQLS